MSAPSGFLLVHSPLLGPAAWQRCADVLRGRGHQVVVPDCRAAVADPDRWWERWVELCAAAAPERPDVLAGHSRSGVVLPLLAARLRPRVVAFVDAVLPALHGATAPSEQSRAFARTLAAGTDRLPVWTDWWPREEIERLLPDAAVRATVIDEQPALAAGFYDVAVPVPDGWDTGPAVHYLLFSEAYDEAAAEAAARGWPITHLPGTHLELLTDPGAVATAVERLRP